MILKHFSKYVGVRMVFINYRYVENVNIFVCVIIYFLYNYINFGKVLIIFQQSHLFIQSQRYSNRVLFILLAVSIFNMLIIILHFHAVRILPITVVAY